MNDKTYDVAQARLAQANYCRRTDAPHFAPHDGRCYRCHHNIYAPVEKVDEWDGKPYTAGITVEKAGTELVTGCLHCHISYCE